MLAVSRSKELEGQAGQYMLSSNQASAEKRSFSRARAPSIASVLKDGEDAGYLGAGFVALGGYYRKFKFHVSPEMNYPSLKL